MKFGFRRPQASQADEGGGARSKEREKANGKRTPSAMERKEPMGFMSSFWQGMGDAAGRRLDPDTLYIVGARGGHSIFACGAHVVSKGLALRPWVEATQRRRRVSQALSQGVPLSCLFCSMEEN
jgi:hypothetical protein